MSNPWDNEPTPMTDSLFDGDAGEYAIGVNKFLNLERRMRAAEKLIKIGGKWDGNYDWERWRRECNEHIEAAFKEDNT